MVAKIAGSRSIKSTLNYNEQKVTRGIAHCLYAHNFLKDADALSFYEKLHRFEALNELNKRVVANCVHISLNFAAGEMISRERLSEIALVYMQKIGFGDQPFLVYQHMDAGHPHLHLLTTTIQKDGSRISLHNLGKNESIRACREIEIAFGLTRAEKQKKYINEKLDPARVQKIRYGRMPLKRAITEVLDAVLPRYRYASLADLNAVLKLYNVVADKAKTNRQTERPNGLLYRVLDEKGNKIGVPIKASSFYNKPTLPYLEKRFKENEILMQADKKPLKTTLNWVLLGHYSSLESFGKALEKENITLIVGENEQHQVCELTYLDHNTKSVFNGSDIGNAYSAGAILEKYGFRPFDSGIRNVWRSESLPVHPPHETHQAPLPETSTTSKARMKPPDPCQQRPGLLRKKAKGKRQLWDI